MALIGFVVLDPQPAPPATAGDAMATDRFGCARASCLSSTRSCRSRSFARQYQACAYGRVSKSRCRVGERRGWTVCFLAGNPGTPSAIPRRKVSFVTQRPLELILARNLMSALSTPAFLVDEGGVLAFYNEAAGMMLGKRFEELGTVGADEWGQLFGPFDEDGEPIPYDDLPLVAAVRDGRPAQPSSNPLGRRDQPPIEVSAFPYPHRARLAGGIAIFCRPRNGNVAGPGK